MIVYHVTPIENLLSIMKYGLKPRRRAGLGMVLNFCRTKKYAIRIIKAPFWKMRETVGHIILTVRVYKKELVNAWNMTLYSRIRIPSTRIMKIEWVGR